jgi:hypothetical protein
MAMLAQGERSGLQPNRRPDVTVLQSSTGALPTGNMKISPNCVDFD